MPVSVNKTDFDQMQISAEQMQRYWSDFVRMMFEWSSFKFMRIDVPTVVTKTS